jgi:predicted MFS family arabinose efflux permease
VPVTAITSLIALNLATGLLSPFFGPLSDRWGYRVMMLLGLGTLAVGMIAGGLLPLYGVILVALFLAGLGKSLFDPALQAYVGERVPYQRRGLVIGLIEFAWAGSSLIGIPVAGWLIERLGWQAPFLVLGSLSLLSTFALGWLIPADSPQPTRSKIRPLKQAWQQLLGSRAALGGLGFGFFVSVANDNLFVVLGLWLESFGLSLTGLGLAAAVIGLAELMGEGLTAFVADRLGLHRSLIIGVSLATLGYLALPFMGLTLPLALLSLFVLFLFFEFTIVTSISFFTEVLPEARATMMSAVLAVISLGRVLGTLSGGPLWLGGGLFAVVTLSALASMLGLACLVWGVRQRGG